MQGLVRLPDAVTDVYKRCHAICAVTLREVASVLREPTSRSERHQLRLLSLAQVVAYENMTLRVSAPIIYLCARVI